MRLAWANKQEVIAINGEQDNFQLFNLDGGNLKRSIKYGDNIGFIFMTLNTGFTKDGNCFALLESNTGAVTVWDLTSGELTDWVDYRRMNYHLMGSFEIFVNQPHLDSSRLYLAYSNHGNPIIRDVSAKTTVFQHPQWYPPISRRKSAYSLHP